LKRMAFCLLMAAAALLLYIGLEGMTHERSGPLVSPEDITRSDVLLDVSEGAESYIPGAVHIGYTDLQCNDSILKPPEEIAAILGSAGISETDSVVIYGECKPCGGSGVTIHPSTLTYFALRSLGHSHVWVLDGGLNAWVESGRPISKSPSQRAPTVYTPSPAYNLQATTDYIKENQVQLVDARTAAEFKVSTIPGAVNIPADGVVLGGRLRDDAELEEIFSDLRRDMPVVVFTSTGVKASAVWFALEKVGYDARLFALDKWAKAGQPLVKPPANSSLA